MPIPFLITGLPRSRTAWLAAAASADASICWHEPTAWLDRWQGAFDIWRDGTHAHVGISDSGLGFHLPEIIERASPRVLVIERDMAEVEAFGVRQGYPRTNYLELLKGALAYDHPLIERVPFAALTNDRVVADRLKHLMPGMVVDMDRIAMLQRLNIQTDLARVNRDAPNANVSAILGADIAAKLVRYD